MLSGAAQSAPCRPCRHAVPAAPPLASGLRLPAGGTMGGPRPPRHVRPRARSEGAQGPSPGHHTPCPRRELGTHPRGDSAAGRAPLGRYAAGLGRASEPGRGRLRLRRPHAARCGAPWRTRGGRGGHRDSAGTARLSRGAAGPVMNTRGSADIGPATFQPQTVVAARRGQAGAGPRVPSTTLCVPAGRPWVLPQPRRSCCTAAPACCAPLSSTSTSSSSEPTSSAMWSCGLKVSGQHRRGSCGQGLSNPQETLA